MKNLQCDGGCYVAPSRVRNVIASLHEVTPRKRDPFFSLPKMSDCCLLLYGDNGFVLRGVGQGLHTELINHPASPWHGKWGLDWAKCPKCPPVGSRDSGIGDWGLCRYVHYLSGSLGVLFHSLDAFASHLIPQGTARAPRYCTA